MANYCAMKDHLYISYTSWIISRNKLDKPLERRINPYTSLGPTALSLTYKDQKSAIAVRRQLCDLGVKINQQLQPVFTSKNIADHLRATEEKPPLINQQSLVYESKCDLCDTNYMVTLATTFISELTNINIPWSGNTTGTSTSWHPST